jgi:hypothetical protein
MAFGLSAINAYGVEVHQFSTKKFVQVLEMDITGTASDVALDIGNPACTFWTAVADQDAEDAVAQIFKKVSKHLSLSVPQLLAKVPVASGATLATTQYKVASPQNTSFAITIYAGEGLTAYSLAMSWTLKDGEFPVVYSA